MNDDHKSLVFMRNICLLLVMMLFFITISASTVDPQECPLVGLYNLRGAIGPPYISSRHKRNHNKGHHHHHEAQYKR